MRVAFDSRGATDPRGIGRYVRCLLDGLRATADGHELVEGHRPRDADVYHSPWIDGAALHARCPQVVTLHDLVPLKRRAEYLRTGARFRLRYHAVQRAARLIVPTHAVARDAVAQLGIVPQRITVIPEAAAAPMHPRPAGEVHAVRERHGLPDEYLVWVGGLEHPDPRKRVAAMARAPRELPLVLVGPCRPWARELPDVILTGLVDDDDLAAIYTGARALVFPSDDEGFGLPTVEALACGTPVVACD
ncbi:MAG: glycosyl transferase group 1, partial [Solirubrobacterales bacterium]|nr:glycosyl transferase group 1 [Solirubrobacterales bacterium]